MGFWSKMIKQSKNVQYVQVSFRSLRHILQPNHSSGLYTYSWSLAETAAPGVWVEVTGTSRSATAVVTAVGVSPPANVKIKPVLRCIAPAELEQARASALQEEKDLESGMHVWLDMMRAKAGLPVTRELPPKEPKGYPPIPARSGKVIGQPAYDRGRVWMRAHHKALERGRSEDATVFEEIAQEWYKRGRKRKAN